MGVLIKLLWVLGVLVFGYAFLTLLLSMQHTIQVVSLVLLTGIIFVLLGIIASKQSSGGGKNLLSNVFQNLIHTAEIYVFDKRGHLTLTNKSGHHTISTTDLLKNILAKCLPSMETEKLEHAIESWQPCDVYLSGGGAGAHQGDKWWNVKVLPQNKHLLVSVSDLTPALSNYSQLRKAYDDLEKFIDSAPFGIFYTSRSGHFVGVNGTFANWVGRLKEEIIGKRVSDFIEHQDNHWLTLKADTLITLYQTQAGSAHLVMRMNPIHGGSSSANEDSFEKALLPSIKIDRKGFFTSQNAAFRSLVIEQLEQEGVAELMPLICEAQQSEVQKKISRLFDSTHAFQPFEVRFGEDKIHTTAYPAKIDKEQLLVQFIDISEQKRLEQQFIQSQKMQAVGQLAGGIAHDFNNLLTAMLGFCDLLLQRYIPSDPSYNDVMQIKQNAQRAANLVRQLLAFSRQQTLQPKVTNITDVLAELTALMRRLIGAGIDLQMIHGRDLWPVKVDASQLEQVIINLVVNARDAMGQEGRLLIQTSNYHTSKVTRLGHDMMPKGDYVLVEVKDSGHGITTENMERIFEPFFSTKEVGAGTGLGLSTVYGIVKQTGGFVGVESQTIHPSGTVFKIFLPRFEGEDIQEIQKLDIQATDLTGGEKILLVEDEDAVRLFSARALRDKGYTVLEAASGDDALDLIDQGEVFDLLVTDVVMPRMDGPTLCKKIRDKGIDIRTIFISGYTEDTFRKNLDHGAKIHFLAKPFSLKDLATKVKDVLST